MLLPGLVARAQYGMDHWTVSDGLPQGIIRGIAQTPDGYLWITTLDGLVRFDGVRFTIFAKGDTPGLISNRFREMYPGRDGDLWLTNEIGGVTRYHDGAFHSYGMERGIPASVVNALTVNEAGDAWILSANRILQWHQEIGKFVDITAPQTKVNYALLLWDISGFWGRDGAKIYCFANGRFVDYPLPPWLEHESLWGAAVDQHGALWLETSGGKQTRIDRDGTSHALNDSDHPSMSFVDTHQQSWNMRVGDHLSRALNFISSGKSVTIPVTHSYEDRQGNLWFGTEGDGLSTCKSNPFRSTRRNKGSPTGMTTRSTRTTPALCGSERGTWGSAALLQESSPTTAGLTVSRGET